jgi:hypothetical protein
MKVTKEITSVLVLCFISYMVWGQDSLIYEDLVKLNNGFIMKCKITNVTEKGLVLTQQNGETLFFEHNDIKVINQGEFLHPISLDKPIYFDKTRKYLGQFVMGTSFGDAERYGNANRKLFNGRIFEGHVKIRLAPQGGGHYLRLNLARLGLESVQQFSIWHVGTGYEVVFSRKKVSPFIYGNIGLGLGLKLNDDDNKNNTQYTYTSTGGTNYELGAGLLFRSSHGYAYTLGTSFFYQPATIDITYNSPWGGGQNQYLLQLRRSFLKFGFIF